MSLFKAADGMAEHRKELYKLFDFTSQKAQAVKINSLNKKILFWKKRLKDLEQKTPSYSYYSKNRYMKKVNAEIHYLEEQLRFEKSDTDSGEEIKRETFDNMEKQKMKQKAIDTAPIKVRIYEMAYKVISKDDKHLKNFLTESGNANAKLYNPIIIRTNFTKEQVRHHLSTAIDEGIDPNLPGINKKLVDGMLTDLLLDIGFTTKDVTN